MKKLLKNKKGVFGLTAVQAFFAIILGIALLAYIIVVIMGTLGGTNILDQLSGSVTNESGAYINSTSYTLDQAGLDGFGSASVVSIYNASDGVLISSGNYTLTGAGVLSNATATTWGDVNISYTYLYNSIQQSNLNTLLTNTSTGITGFFSAISPIYAILAVLVIILVLVVLVRIVQTPKESQMPQL
jgi:hypothetical protein